MREPASCADVRRRLVRHGLPADRIERIVRELSEHWEDLRTAALDRGCPPAEAVAEAEARLGHPEQLAVEAISGLRRSSWLGRHPVVALCLAPLLLAPVLMGLIAGPLWCLDQWVHFSHWGDPAGQPNEQLIVGVTWGIYYAALVGAPAWICWWSWRAGLGLRWVLAMCAWSALASLVRYFNADSTSRQITAGFRFPWPLNARAALILLFHCSIAAAFLLAVRNHTKKTSRPNEDETSLPL